MADDVVDKKPGIEIRFFYLMCNDVEVMRGFYTGLLGMEECGYHNDGSFGYLMYRAGQVEILFFRAENELAVPSDFSSQPGWEGGTLEIPSWSVLIPEESFAECIKALQAADVPKHFDKPQWCVGSYWSFPVLDPMGNTVEVYTMPAETPADETWPD